MKSLHQKRDLDKRHTTTWHSYTSVRRWSVGLLNVTGLTPDEITNRLDTLFQFCLQHEIDPEVMAEECRKGAERVAKRAFYLRSGWQNSREPGCAKLSRT